MINTILRSSISSSSSTVVRRSAQRLAAPRGSIVASQPSSSSSPRLVRSCLGSTIQRTAIRSYSTEAPKSPPKPAPFFSRKTTLKPEVTPLIIFVGAVATAALTAVFYHLFRDKDLRLKHGDSIVDQNDEALEKALAEPDPKPSKKKTSEDVHTEAQEKKK